MLFGFRIKSKQTPSPCTRFIRLTVRNRLFKLNKLTGFWCFPVFLCFGDLNGGTTQICSHCTHKLIIKVRIHIRPAKSTFIYIGLNPCQHKGTTVSIDVKDANDAKATNGCGQINWAQVTDRRFWLCLVNPNQLMQADWEIGRTRSYLCNNCNLSISTSFLGIAQTDANELRTHKQNLTDKQSGVPALLVQQWAFKCRNTPNKNVLNVLICN